MNYNREQVDVLFDLTSRITLRGGYRYEWGDGLTDGALISGAATETGQLKRKVGLAGVSYRASQELASASISKARAETGRTSGRACRITRRRASRRAIGSSHH